MQKYLAILALTFGGLSVAAPIEPGPTDALTLNFVASLLEEAHYTGSRVDDVRSSVWLSDYLDTLDYGHMVFLQSDVDEFARFDGLLDDEVIGRQPPLGAATIIYERYRTRFLDRLDGLAVILESPIDVETEREWVVDRTKQAWPSTEEESVALWRDRLVEQMIEGQLQGREAAEQRELLGKRYNRIKNEVMQVTTADLLEVYISALARTYDPHSSYFKPSSNENFDIEMSNSLEGIGATLQSDGEYTTVMSLVPGGPADKEGSLQPGDRIIAVAQGEVGKASDIVALRLDDVVDQIRGERGSIVRLTVIPADASDISDVVEVRIVRDKVIIEETKASGMVKTVSEKGHTMRIGVIDVPSFYIGPKNWDDGGVSADVERIIGELTVQGIDALLLDLRFNGGGSLGQSVQMTGLFIDRGPVVQIRERSGEIEHLKDKIKGRVYGGPLVVLTSEFSASASEIVAGALKDYGRALIVGSQTTHGKGTVQTMFDLSRFIPSASGGMSSRGAAVKLTTQKFYMPLGSATQQRGVPSDVILPSTYEGMDVSEADLENVLAWDEVSAAKVLPEGNVSALLPALQQQSDARVADSPYFAWVGRLVQERKASEDNKAVALSLSSRTTDADAREARIGENPLGEDEDEDDAGVTKPRGDLEEDEKERPDPTLDEALSVTVDYIVLSGT
jgi:carboxyl-terminal processing protease